jgi:hypothetical protein
MVRRNAKTLRFHFHDRQTSIEGVLVRTRRNDYVVESPKLIEGPESTVTLSGPIEIPKTNVLFKQVLTP